ncbi:MAG TPA: hypothetical protein VG733_18550 [Chthoniobacteraceae bacterium]|nr:hypothetical protein [Chthoniobacteraceae bacterium]
MGSLSARQFIEILVEKCPSYDKALVSCALSKFREETNIQKRREMVTALNDAQIEELYRQHLECVNRVCGG